MMYKVDWQRYYSLERKGLNNLTPEELDFYKYMYYVEEVLAGLDGDCDDR